ncbi:LOG family protein [Ramlibacter tataouinensis]|uniref:Cytokinin riboside 5'-monophosphate phosphoribohydrolase n=1 Tax=Ramlibacter tataouinensis TaxID=94132 RepID=A0A127JNM1_9BURK|nr:TIGR00730 family Rossman fold protein [Ramlibacter tataouinensis]AMO21604.1 LOG family protein [Ramlibacter tataouinensis]
MTPAFSLCVYCGSRTGRVQEFKDLAVELGRWIGERGGQLVYGGGNAGLMGLVADATLAAGGTVIGVIPQALVEREHAKRDCTQLFVVDNMHERKRLMAEHSEAFLALPGGIGTLEEFFEVWTWRQLGYHDKPIGLLNANGYYDPLLAFLHAGIQAEFMSDWLMDLIRVGDRVDTLVPQLLQAGKLSAGVTDLSEI